MESKVKKVGVELEGGGGMFESYMGVGVGVRVLQKLSWGDCHSSYTITITPFYLPFSLLQDRSINFENVQVFIVYYSSLYRQYVNGLK